MQQQKLKHTLNVINQIYRINIMKLLRDFLCPVCNKSTERYIDSETRMITCECGNDAARVIGMPRVKLEGITGAFPGAYHKWATDHEKRAKKRALQERE